MTEPTRCPECASEDRNKYNLISHGALVPCDDPYRWHKAPAPAKYAPCEDDDPRSAGHCSKHGIYNGRFVRCPYCRDEMERSC